MKLLVRMVDDNGEPINDKEILIEPKNVEVRGIETVYTFEAECHELNKEEFHKYLSEVDND